MEKIGDITTHGTKNDQLNDLNEGSPKVPIEVTRTMRTMRYLAGLLRLAEVLRLVVTLMEKMIANISPEKVDKKEEPEKADNADKGGKTEGKISTRKDETKLSSHIDQAQKNKPMSIPPSKGEEPVLDKVQEGTKISSKKPRKQISFNDILRGSLKKKNLKSSKTWKRTKSKRRKPETEEMSRITDEGSMLIQ